jgi:hypothetical protein
MVIALAAWLPESASAELIVDTGTPSGVGAVGLAITNGSNNPIESLQYLAGEFTTTQSYDITSLSAFVEQYTGQVCPCTPMTATFHLGLATGPANPAGATFTDLFSLPISFTSISSNSLTTSGWASVSVPNYLLPAGTYWLVASATSTDDTIGLGMPGGVPDPMSAYAITDTTPDNWGPLTTFDVDESPTLGFQIGGQPVNPVPLPDTLGLLATGLAALGLLRGRTSLRL